MTQRGGFFSVYQSLRLSLSLSLSLFLALLLGNTLSFSLALASSRFVRLCMWGLCALLLSKETSILVLLHVRARHVTATAGHVHLTRVSLLTLSSPWTPFQIQSHARLLTSAFSSFMYLVCGLCDWITVVRTLLASCPRHACFSVVRTLSLSPLRVPSCRRSAKGNLRL